jgi:hypothetical protein
VQSARTPAGDAASDEVLRLWYELGRLYSGAAGGRDRALALGFAVTLVTGALVLLSGYFFGTEWAGPFAALIPVAAGFLAGGGLFGWRRMRFAGRRGVLARALAREGFDAERPAREDLGAYYDAQLILLRSQYEYLSLRGYRRTTRLFEESFGFTPEDPFETGPLNVAPDTRAMRTLRERWERRLETRRRLGKEPPALGLREDLAYRVFPREMTVPAELATRRAYLTISRDLLIGRYGRDPRREVDLMSEDLRRRVEKDLREHAALTRRVF